jgi:hypothetical protein
MKIACARLCFVLCLALAATALTSAAPQTPTPKQPDQPQVRLSQPDLTAGTVLHYTAIITGTRGQPPKVETIPEVRVPFSLTIDAASDTSVTMTFRPSPPPIKDLPQGFMVNNFLIAASMRAPLRATANAPTQTTGGSWTILNGPDLLAAGRDNLDDLIQQAIGPFKGLTLEQINKERATFGALLSADAPRTMLELYSPFTNSFWTSVEPIEYERDIPFHLFAGLTVPAKERTTVRREQDGTAYTRTVVRSTPDADFVAHYKAVGEKIGLTLTEADIASAAERGDIYFETRTDFKTDAKGLLTEGTIFIEHKFGVARRSFSRTLRIERAAAPAASEKSTAAADTPRIPMDWKPGEEVAYRAIFRLTLGQGTQQDRLPVVRMPFTIRVVAREGPDAIIECDALVPRYAELPRDFLHNYARTLAPFEGVKPRIRIAADATVVLLNQDEVAKAAARCAGPIGDALGLYKSLNPAQRTQTQLEFEKILAKDAQESVLNVLAPILSAPNSPIPAVEIESDDIVRLATGRELKGRLTFSVEQTKQGFKRSQKRVARNSPELGDAMLRTLIDMGYKLNDQEQRRVRDSRSANVRTQLTQEVDPRGWLIKGKSSTLLRSGIASIAFDEETEVERTSDPKQP